VTRESFQIVRAGSRAVDIGTLEITHCRALIGVALVVFFARLHDRPVIAADRYHRLVPRDYRAGAEWALRLFREERRLVRCAI
jgi:hypothetical protein